MEMERQNKNHFFVSNIIFLLLPLVCDMINEAIRVRK